MTRTTTLALFMGLLIGFAAAQLITCAQAQSPATTIKTNDGVIVFIVEGQEAARIDASGLHVRGDLAYGGTITDYGSTGFDAYVKNGGGRDAK